MKITRSVAAIAGAIVIAGGFSMPAAAAPSVTPIASASEYVVTVTNAGDPATQVSLRVPYTVGMSGQAAYTSSGSGSLDASWDPNQVTNFEYQASGTSSYEVIAVGPDGSYDSTVTSSATVITNTYANPNYQAGTPYNWAALDGFPVMTHFNADGTLSSARALPPSFTPTAEQQELIDIQSSQEGYSPVTVVPDTPVGVGATWSVVAPFTLEGLHTTITMNYQLTSVTNGQYAYTATYSLDVATMDPAGYPEDVVGATGSMFGATNVVGSLTDPTQVASASVNGANNVVFDYGQGDTFTMNYAYTDQQSPAPAPAPA